MADAASPGGAGSSSSLRVLVAEDTPVNARVIKLLLGQLGHEAEVVPDGRLAVEAAGRGGFDLILMDIRMPELDGIAATRLIRSSEQQSGKRVPILALTGSNLTEDVDRCRAAGMDGHIAKPVALRALANAIDAVLSGAPAPAQPPPARSPKNAAPFDRERALAALAGQSELLAEVQQSVLEQSPAVLDELSGALDAADAARLEDAAHRLKSMLGLLAADASVRAAQRLERLARSQRLDACQAAMAVMERELAKLLEALRRSASP